MPIGDYGDGGDDTSWQSSKSTSVPFWKMPFRIFSLSVVITSWSSPVWLRQKVGHSFRHPWTGTIRRSSCSWAGSWWWWRWWNWWWWSCRQNVMLGRTKSLVMMVGVGHGGGAFMLQSMSWQLSNSDIWGGIEKTPKTFLLSLKGAKMSPVKYFVSHPRELRVKTHLHSSMSLSMCLLWLVWHITWRFLQITTKICPGIKI